MTGVTAFILAGGKSTRMGRDKAFLPWEGRPLLERALEAARTVTADVRIVGAREKFEQYGDVVEDIYPERGPLGGIHAALRTTATDLNLVLAVDLPFVTPGLLSYLIERVQDVPNQDAPLMVTVPRLSAGWEPLCAVYPKQFVEAAEEALREGRNAIHPLLDRMAVRTIDEGELIEAGFSVQMFRNINTIMDLALGSGTES
jgi:molybdopterin-guanine dinucleotide biosynthesis protein A